MSLKALYFQTLILAGLILFSFGSQTNAQSITVDIPDNQTAATGTNVSIPVTIVYNYTPQPENLEVDPPVFDPNRIPALSFAVNFNPAVITPRTGIDPVTNDPRSITRTGTLTANSSCEVNTATPGRIGIACATGGGGAYPPSGTQSTLIILNFTVVGQPNAGSCCTALTFSQAAGEAPRFQNRTGATVPTTATAGSFFVTGTTAASVNVTGRVLTAEGRGLRGAQVRLTQADGTTKIVMTSSFGYYRFADIQAGQTVTLQILSKKYGFQAHTVNLTGDVTDLDFVAER